MKASVVKVASGLVVAASIALCGQVQAQVVSGSTTLTAPGTIAAPFSAGQLLALGGTVLNTGTTPPVAFYDNYVFTVGAGQSLTVTVSPVTATATLTVLGASVTLASFSGATANLSGVTDTFYSGSVSTVSQLGGANPDAALAVVSPTSVFGPGTYTLEVAGSITGKSTVTSLSAGLGAFAQQVSFAAAVPEPATYGLMVAGLGLVFFAVRRRRS